MYGCPNFNQRKKCPPHDTLSPTECREYISEYTNAILIRFKPDEHSLPPKHDQSLLLEIERQSFLWNYRFALSFFPHHCEMCKTCSLEKPCNNPIKARPSVSSYCIDVLGTLDKMGLIQKIVSSKEKPEPFYYVGLILLS
jgi:predicted metal-binding protein